MQEHVQESVHLPQECIRHILSFVGDGDYYSAMQVSKEWLSAARCEKLPFWCEDSFLSSLRHLFTGSRRPASARQSSTPARVGRR